jgi:hypothetical protein
MSAERRASTRIDDQQAVGLVLAQLSRDVRGASDLGTGTAPPAEIDLTEADGTHVRWAVDNGGGRLVRYLGAAPGVSVGNVTTATAIVLLDAAGDPLVAGSPDTAADVVHCAAGVQATVVLNDGVSETAVAQLPGVPLDESGSAVTGVEPGDRWPGCP